MLPGIHQWWFKSTFQLKKISQSRLGVSLHALYCNMQTKHFVISYCRECLLSPGVRVGKKRKKKFRAAKQRASTAIACEAREGERDMKKRTESIFWPYVARQRLRVCALSLTGLGDGCVTAGRAGCMSCSQISDTPRGMLRKEAGLMG